MSCAGRTFPELGRKIIAAIPLAFQKVAADDSVLGSLVQSDGTGLATSYSRLIRKAFDRRYGGKSRRDKFTFAPDGTLVPDSSGFTQTEHNFSMFFGLAIQLYEATLISDDSPFDKFAKKTGGDDSALTAQQKSGLEIFLGQGKCIACHSSAMFTKASLLHLQDENEEEGLVEYMLMGDANNGPALYDNGFYNIGVTPTFEDIGRGGTGPFGVPLSFTRQFTDSTPPCTTDAPNDECIDMFEVNPCTFEIPFTGQTPANCANFIPDGGIADHRVAVDGAMKVPTLRNVGLTAPFFHNGGQATLAQVVAFYNRGGDRRGNCNDGNTDTTALRDGPCNLDPDIDVLGLDSGQQEDLVAFLLALTDERVNCEKAPFDHPEITVTEGHSTTDSDGDGKADDIMLTIDAVGAGGLSSCFTNSGDYFIK
jgi:cytochrome c peroxidase